MVLVTGLQGRDDLSSALTHALRFGGVEHPESIVERLATALQRACVQDELEGQEGPDLALGLAEMAEEIGAALAALDADLDPACVLGRVVGAVQDYYGTHGSAAALGALLQRLCVGYVGALRGSLRDRQSAPPDEDTIEHVLAGGAGGRDARLLRAVFAQSGIGVGISDITGQILVVNSAFAAMFGYSVSEFVQFNITDLLVHPDDTPEVWSQYAALMRGSIERVSLEKPHLHRDGHTIWHSINVSLIRDQKGAPVYTLALFEEVTDRRHLEERMRYQALHDPLTGLANRSQFFDSLAKAFENPDSRVGVCYIDMDGFETVNDTLGHDVGDRLLVEVADRLGLCLRRPNQLAARMGGDEFIILIPQSHGSGEVTQLADALLHTVTSPVDIDGRSVTVSASVGVMEDRAGDTSPIDLMKNADTALVRAKQAGRNQWAIYDRDDENLNPPAFSPMREALERSEFYLVYQPVVRLSDNCIIGAEALLRWAHPTLGTLLPGRFIAFAESSGLIASLTAFVLEEACRHVQIWRQNSTDPQPFVSVNISASCARDADFCSLVERVLADADLPPQALQLEITENANLSKDETTLSGLRRLSTLGVSIAIDDFGTGFSSLAYLRTLPANVVKLAGEFVANLDLDTHDRFADEKIARAIIDLAHALGLTVTAERVESPSQAAQLRALDCDTAQGWHFAKPLPANFFSE